MNFCFQVPLRKKARRETRTCRGCQRRHPVVVRRCPLEVDRLHPVVEPQGDATAAVDVVAVAAAAAAAAAAEAAAAAAVAVNAVVDEEIKMEDVT